MIFNRALSPAESKEVFPSVRKHITADRFHARGIELNRNNELEQWHIEVDRSAEQWFAVNDHGHTHEYRDGQTFRRGQSVEHHTTMESGRGLVPPLQAVFPGQLRWWGEYSHDFRPVLVETVGKRSHLLTFEHGADPSMRSTMVIDTELGLVTRVMHFGAPYILLLDVELHRGIERVVPETFPEPEVIYPDY